MIEDRFINKENKIAKQDSLEVYFVKEVFCN